MKSQREDKCPLCGKEMMDADGDMICPECGYHKSYAASMYEEAKQKTVWAQEMRTKKKSAFGKSIAITASVILVALLAVLVGSRREGTGYSAADEEMPQTETEDIQNMIQETRPHMMQQLSTEIFHKDYTQVMGEDLDQVVALDFYSNDARCRMVDYRLADGTERTVYFGDAGFDGSQISRFKGLRSLKMDYGNVYSDDLYGMGYLTELWSNQDFNEVAQMIDPLQITSLGVNSYMDSGLSGIEQFRNLTSLYMDCYQLESLTGLASLVNLRTLILEDIDSVEDYAELYDMSKLEKLYIDGGNLSDLGFVSNMKNLKELTICNSKLENIECLSDCKDTLEVLDLSNNKTITDYRVISKMTHLSELTLNTGYVGDAVIQMPDLSGMPDLTKLHIGYYDEFEEMIRIPQLEELTLSDAVIKEFPLFDELSKLKTLNLEYMSVSSQAVEDIRKMTRLESISLENSHLRGDVSALLNLPLLHDINMEYCSAKIDFDHLRINETLELINLNHAKWSEYEEGEDTYSSEETEINFAEHTEIFAFYPDLKELYLEGQQLDDISFTADLKKLQFLDIYNNNVTDLTPLTKLEDLRFVVCRSNPIEDYTLLGSKVSKDW